ncbi:MAG: hypothetical protein JWM99_1594 [Verrucomicrobiales bacterium]|jgi:hypothetical protein|nr:hypothetical protein [Verrucomicrobiales bacterium]
MFLICDLQLQFEEVGGCTGSQPWSGEELKHIYAKLDVQSRSAAFAKALLKS